MEEKKEYQKTKKMEKKKKTPPSKDYKKERFLDLNILQANVCGLDRKKIHLGKLFNDKKIHVAVLQETQHSSCDVNIIGYTPYPCKCNNC